MIYIAQVIGYHGLLVKWPDIFHIRRVSLPVIIFGFGQITLVEI